MSLVVGYMLRICLCFLIIACSSKKAAVHPGVIIGKNDIMLLSEVRGDQIAQEVLETAVKASVLVVTVLLDEDNGKSNLIFCSGSLISAAEKTKNPRIVTNHHCLSERMADGKMLDKLLPEACEQTLVYFNFSTAKEILVRKCQPGSLRSSWDIDLAVFTLDTPMPEEHRPLQIWEGSVPQRLKVFVVHHPNTTTQNKQTLPYLNTLEAIDEGVTINALAPIKMITINDCLIIGGFSKDLWAQDPRYPYTMLHTCDLLSGSSGSGLLDLKSGKLLAVNWGSIPPSPDTDGDDYNFASSAEFLQKFIAGEPLDYSP